MPTPHDILRTVFGFDDFIGLQGDVIPHVAEGGDAVVLMPTGGGKSLCYQIPAMLRDGFGVVVSPLIALMRDQVAALRQAGVRAACLNSSLSMQEMNEVQADLEYGRLDLLYVAPERLCRPEFLERLARLRPNLFAIDEAHCVSQWGHDFRPEYLQLSIIPERFPGVPRVALTATADLPTRNDILTHLGLDGARIFANGFDRPNIRYTVQPKDKPQHQLLQFIRNTHQGDSGIIYRISRKKTDQTAAFLNKNGITALPYHAGLSAEERNAHQERFMREEGLVMVATVAFGMGVDKPDVRFVAHLEPPRSLEAYHQETGRAGRDGLPADAWMTYGLQDFAIMRSMIVGGDADDRRKFVEHRKLDSIMAFLEAPGCRRQALLSYFGESIEPCRNCDTCAQPPKTWNGTVAAQKALSNIFRTGQRFGAKHLADVLKGETSKRISQLGHDQLSTYGIGDELSGGEWRSVYRQLGASGLLEVDIEGHGALHLNENSWQVLRGEREVVLRTDPVVPKVSRRRTRGERIDEEGTLATSEARILFDALRAKRAELASERGIPPYAVFPDRTLLEMVRYRPSALADLGLLSGIGEMKLQSFGETFLAVLEGHEAINGRPDDLPPLPQQRSTAKPARKGASESALESARAFTRLGNVEEVAQERNLKASTVWIHLASAVSSGEYDWRDLCVLEEDAVREIRDVMTAFRTRGIMELSPVHEELQGRYDYGLLRIIRNGLNREGASK